MAVAVTKPPTPNECHNLHDSAGCTVEKTLLRRIPEGNDQLAEEVRDPSVWNIGDQSVEDECPCKGVNESFLELIGLEMFVADTLLVDTDALNAESSVFFAEPASVELVVWHHEEEHDADGNGKEACDEEDDLPRSDGGRMYAGPVGDSIGYTAAEDLSEAVEAEPDACSEALFSLGIPL